MSIFDGRLLAFDVETTSPEPEEARIVTAALAEVGAGQPPVVQTWLANPGVPIPEEAAAIHGVSTERAEAEGQPAGQVIGEVLFAIAEAVARGVPVVAFNARYDLTVLDREVRRHGLEPRPMSLTDLRVIDPLVIDKWLDRYRPGSRKLDAIAAHYGARLDGAHDAASDALAAARVAWVLGKKGQVTRRVRDRLEMLELEALCEEWDRARDSLDALHAAQERWAYEQAVGLQEHFRRQGKDEQVEPAWPIIPRLRSPDPPAPVTAPEGAREEVGDDADH